MADGGAQVLELEEALAQAKPAAPRLAHIAARILNTPLLISPPKLHAILAAIGPRIGLTVPPVTAQLRGVIRQDRSRDYQVIDGVAVIELFGTIVKRNDGGVLSESGTVSSEAARQVILAALADANVRAVLLQMDSYGGEAQGTGELSAFIRQAREESPKPIWGLADESAYSAGYYVLSGAARVVVAPSGGLGSIGCIAVHVDESKALEMAGLSVSAVYAGARKNDFSPFAPLSPEAQAVLTARVNQLYDEFVAAVAENRGLSPQAVRATEAGCFYGPDAVRAGLADAVGTFDEILLELASTSAGGSRRGGIMAEKVGDAAAAETADVVNLAERRKEREAGEAAGATAERARVKGIRETAQLSRLPRKDSDALVDELVNAGTSVDAARARFLEAQAKAQSPLETRPDLGGGSAVNLPDPPRPKSRQQMLDKRRDVMAGRRQPLSEQAVAAMIANAQGGSR